MVQETTIDENNGRCRSVGQTTDGLPAFLYLQPCPKSVNADVGFDSTRVPNGSHHLVVTVSDAAGNTATVLDRTIVVENELGICNAQCDGGATLHAADAKLLGRTLVRRYANSGLTLTGQLMNSAGSPMPGATLELRQEAAYPGAQNALVTTTTTDARGNWTLRVPKGPSRLHHRWLSRAQQQPDLRHATPVPRDGRGGRAALGSATRATGRPFTFHGSLAGGYIPPGGALVSLEILFAGEWREIALLRTNHRGAFAYHYTFAAIGPATYRFRAALPHTVGYPFASGASRSSHIHLAG